MTDTIYMVYTLRFGTDSRVSGSKLGDVLWSAEEAHRFADDYNESDDRNGYAVVVPLDGAPLRLAETQMNNRLIDLSQKFAGYNRTELLTHDCHVIDCIVAGKDVFDRTAALDPTDPASIFDHDVRLVDDSAGDPLWLIAGNGNLNPEWNIYIRGEWYLCRTVGDFARAIEGARGGARRQPDKWGLATLLRPKEG